MARHTVLRGPDGKRRLKFKDEGEMKEPVKRGRLLDSELRTTSEKKFSKKDLSYIKGVLREFGTKEQRNLIEETGLGNCPEFIQTLLDHKSLFEENTRKRREETLGDESVHYRMQQEAKQLLSKAISEGQAKHIRAYGPMKGSFGAAE